MILLDSQVLVWSLTKPSRLGRRALARIESGREVHVSAASIWELTIKSMLGKVQVPDDLAANIVDLGFIPLAVTTDHAAAVREFPELLRHDPFDRLLVAQAHHLGMQLLTADRVLLGLSHDFVVDATR